MAKIILEIQKCWDGCPYCKSRCGGHGDADDWFCTYNAESKRVIASYVEYTEEMPFVPKWCPIKLNEESNN